MEQGKVELPDGILKLLPLTPAVFVCLFALADGAKHGYAMTQTSEARSRIIRAIKSRDITPELIVRSLGRWRSVKCYEA